MKHALLYVFGLIVIGSLGAATPAAADSVGPYYATPSWDQQLPASTRFIVLSNWIDASFPSGGAAVLDRETGLVWERSPSTLQVNWSHAHIQCVFNSRGNRFGWRVPTLEELASLIDPTVFPASPTLPAGHPFQHVQPSDYWSATDFGTASVAYVADFADGGVSDIAKTSNAYVWCVRGGQGVNPQ